jgi:peptidoglycan/LPS O-acetylase OafA/YrhL
MPDEAVGAARANSGVRSSALDGVRGLAAGSVVTLHLMSVFLDTQIPQYRWFDQIFHRLSYTPFAALWAGGQAVTIFFVLSGFALHRMLAHGASSYCGYAARRIIRLWIPYAVVITLACISIQVIGSHKIAVQSDWMNSFLGVSPSPQLLAQHLSMVGVFDTRPLDFVVWSLVLEMRMSLVFPIIYWATERVRPGINLAGSLFIASCAVRLQHHTGSSSTSLMATFVCQVYFVIGALLSKYEGSLRRLYSQIPRPLKWLLFATSVVLYCNCLRLSATYSTMLGATWLIIIALCSQRARHSLNRPAVQFFGRISYSLYLAHGVVLLSLINLLYPRLPFGAIVAIALPAALIVSTALNRFVEQPSIAWSQLTGRLTEGRGAARQLP